MRRNHDQIDVSLTRYTHDLRRSFTMHDQFFDVES
jgi:hypothetical protein